MSENPEYHLLPQPHELSEQEKEDAMGAYLMMFAAIGAGLPLPVINIIAAVVYYYLNKGKSRFVRFHCHQALFSQLPTSLMNAGALFWGVRIFFSDEWHFNNVYTGYLGTVVVFNIVYFVWGIMAAIQARKGRTYYISFFGRWSYQRAFAIKPERAVKQAVNMPPV